MTTCYKDEDGNVICSDEYIFPEDIEDTHIKCEWYLDAEKVYIEILKENTRYYSNYIRGKF